MLMPNPDANDDDMIKDSGLSALTKLLVGTSFPD